MKTKLNLLVAGIFLAAANAGLGQPVITNQPRLLATALGTTATFTVGAKGTAPLAYQWQKDLSDLPGRTNAVLALTDVQISDQADYRVVVSDGSQSVTSAVAHLYVMSFAAVTARTVLDNFDDNRLTGWATYGSGLLIESNQQFTARGYWPGQRTLSTYDTFCVGALSTYRAVGQGQTVEWRVDLVQMDENATNAVKFLVGTTSGGYGLFKWRDFILLDKYEGGLARLYTFDRASIPNTNVVVAFALTRAGPNVILTGRVLDKQDPAVVLYERSFVDTPGSDPTLTTADVEQLSGMHLDFRPDPSAAPYSYVLSAIGLFQYTDGSQPAATVTYDNFEVWTYRVPVAHYVDASSANPTPPYTNWLTAATNIQDAVDVALAGDEIVVTNGIYATGGRAVGTNLLVNRVAVDKPLTLRSVNGPQFTIIQGYQVPGTTNGDGAIRCVYLADGASLSGFTLTKGATRTDGDYYDQCGGGVWCEYWESAVVSNCVVVGNSAYGGGGGAYDGTLNNCMLTGNSAESGGGAYGGTLNNCMLTDNRATGDGSIFSGWGGGAFSSTLNNCTLTGNSAYSGGGANNGNLYNCTLTGNSAQGGGGATGATLNNGTLFRNSATRIAGGATFATLNNCIVYFNTAPEAANYRQGDLNYCCTTPLPAGGVGNISLDPQLASTTHLSSGSPCRGAGSAAFATGTDIDGEVWATPPSIGCDEYHAGAVTGPLSVSIRPTYTNVMAGFPVGFTALTEGRTSATAWDFPDGMVTTNQPFITHAWTTLGDYAVVLRAYNESNPGGVSATVTVHVVAQPVHYVSAASINPLPPYTAWATAATNIQDAVDAADAASFPPGSLLVLVTNGVYASGGRAVYGTMTNRVVVDKRLTLQSVNGPEFTIIKGYQVPGTTNGCGEGAIRCVYLTSGASLSGFTLTKGATRSYNSSTANDQQSGGGLWCESTTAVISNCVVIDNSSGFVGGGVSGGTLNYCTIATNSSIYGDGGASGYVRPCTLNYCTLIGNSAEDGDGGGAGSSTLNNCTLTGNSAGGLYGEGGGVADSTLNNCTLARNSATRFAGGAYGGTLNNCTLTGNSAGESGGGAYYSSLNNCIIYFNSAPVAANYKYEQAFSYVTVNYCCVTPIPPYGVGNISVPPLFVDYAGGNLRLQSNSPCINAGLNGYVSSATDFGGYPRIVSGTVDIGAYEFQGSGSTISYAWLQKYGLPTDGSADATDSDKDGLNNWQEWRCRTDPTNALSVLRLLSASRAGANVTVSWQSVSGVNYFLERSADLSANPPFSLLSTGIPGQPGATTYTDTNAASLTPLFYRVGVGQ